MQRDDKKYPKFIKIPWDILVNKDLNLNAKVIFMIIHSFSENNMKCFFSNAYIGNILNIGDRQVSKYIKQLIKMNWIKAVGLYKGKFRLLESCMPTKSKVTDRTKLHKRAEQKFRTDMH